MGKENLPELNSIWDDARGFIERGDFDKAIEIYKYILVRYGDNTVAVEYALAFRDVFIITVGMELVAPSSS